METTRDAEIARMVRYVEQDYIDSDGEKMLTPSQAIYQSLKDFLLGISDALFSYLISDKGSVHRLPDGNIFIDLRNEKNRIALGVSFGDNYADFFYSPKKGVRTLGEMQSVEELLKNEDFISSTQKLLEGINEKSKLLNLDFSQENECKPSVPKYSHVS